MENLEGGDSGAALPPDPTPSTPSNLSDAVEARTADFEEKCNHSLD